MTQEEKIKDAQTFGYTCVRGGLHILFNKNKELVHKDIGITDADLEEAKRSIEEDQGHGKLT